MNKFITATALSAVFVSPAFAADHSYTYIEGARFDRSAEWDLDAGEDDDTVEADGWAVAGSYRTVSGVLFQAHYSDGEIDNAWGVKKSELEGELGSNVDFTIKSYGVFVGGANQINANLSAWGGFGYDREELELTASGYSGSIDYDIDEYSVGGGVRYTPIEYIEINGGARAIHFRADETELLSDYKDTDVEVHIGARVQPIKWVSVGVTYFRQIDADSDNLKLDARLQF